MNSATAERVTVIRSKALYLSLVLIFLSACSDPTIEFGNLVERGGVYYEKFSTEPFSGRVTGPTTGKLVNGRFEGLVYVFMEDGNLLYETNYKGGIKEGLQTRFTTAGREETEFSKGNQVAFREYTDDVLTYKSSYKDGKRHGVNELFYSNGNLKYRVNYNNGNTVEDVIDVFSRDGITHLKVPVSKIEFGILVADGVVEKVGELPCGVLYERGTSTRRASNDVQKVPSMSAGDRIRCVVEIQRLISELRLDKP